MLKNKMKDAPKVFSGYFRTKNVRPEMFDYPVICEEMRQNIGRRKCEIC